MSLPHISALLPIMCFAVLWQSTDNCHRDSIKSHTLFEFIVYCRCVHNNKMAIKYYICRWSGSGHRWPAESNRGMSSTGCWGAAADQCANCHDGLRTNINMAGMCSCGQWTREPILDEGAKKLADPKFIYCTVPANISLSVCGRKRGLDWRTRGLETGPVQSIHSEKLDNKNSHCAHGNVEDTTTTTTMDGMSGRSSSFYYCDHCRRAGVAGAGGSGSAPPLLTQAKCHQDKICTAQCTNTQTQ